MSLASDVLTIAEEIIDRQTTTERFQDRDWELTTGRVLLHALGSDGVVLCGRPAGQVAAIDQLWTSAFLPHLPRCRSCRSVAASADPGRQRSDGGEPDADPPGLPASAVDVRTVHATDTEKAGAAALRDVIGRHDLRAWMFTDLVRVDAQIRGGFSHPLTINPKLLLAGPACALTTFLHEQLHWLGGPGIDAATTEAASRWPHPPPPPAGGHDAESTWLHMSICTLEYQSLSRLIGPASAAAELRQQQYYSWAYSQILADPDWFAGFLDRHGLSVPHQPPVPRRYLGEEWWTAIAGVVPEPPQEDRSQ